MKLLTGKICQLSQKSIDKSKLLMTYRRWKNISRIFVDKFYWSIKNFIDDINLLVISDVFCSLIKFINKNHNFVRFPPSHFLCLFLFLLFSPILLSFGFVVIGIASFFSSFSSSSFFSHYRYHHGFHCRHHFSITELLVSCYYCLCRLHILLFLLLFFSSHSSLINL